MNTHLVKPRSIPDQVMEEAMGDELGSSPTSHETVFWNWAEDREDLQARPKGGTEQCCRLVGGRALQTKQNSAGPYGLGDHGVLGQALTGTRKTYPGFCNTTGPNTDF
ncbi:hypothetical protein NPIL_114691 [Nephila pilipes]|uniref:Uncharacterized protein n=1 Tax=Nephila pilipes TaxID=299642 RepID=A0A8X6U2H8_NEPPI|nr:hypothetical protein NPIL_114691 [Nephila pilipes]